MLDFFVRPEAAEPAALRENQTAAQPYRPIRVLAMSPDYKGEVGLLKDRDSVASRFGAILGPDTFEELLEQLRTIGKGGRIEQLVFIGHGNPDGGKLGFAGDVTASELTVKAALAQRAGDSRLLDAFSQGAEVIFYNCYVGKDPQFLQSAARLFLAFSGGTVYGSSDAVASSASTINNLMFIVDYWMPFLGLGEGVNFRSPSAVDYHKFKNYSLEPLLQRGLQPEPVSIEGVREIEPLHRAPLRAIAPERFTNAFFGPFVKFKWSRRDGPRWRPAAEGREVALEVDPNNVEKLALGKNELELRVFLDNGLGARLLGFAPWTITVGASQPADKPPVDAKKPADKAPVEKPPTSTPPPSTPPGAAPGAVSPSSGSAAGGYWKLTDTKESRTANREGYWPGGQVGFWLSNCAINISGTTVSTRATVKPERYSSREADPPPYTLESTGSWTDLPQTVSTDATVSTTLTTKGGGDVSDGWGHLGSSVTMSSDRALDSPATTRLSVNDMSINMTTAKWHLGVASKDAEQRSFTLIGNGPGGSFTRTYIYTWTAGTPGAAPSSNLDVNIAVDKPTVIPGEKALLKANATGGTPPFTFAWAGPVGGTADQITFTAGKAGTQAFTVTVKDSKGATSTASATITTEGPTVALQRTSSGKVVLGLPYGFQAQISAAGKPLAGPFVFRWEPHPEVTYTPHEGAVLRTTAVFTRLGHTRVWVDVLRQEGPVLAAVADSEQMEIDVVSPELSLTANPTAPYAGQDVRINVAMSPAIPDKYVTFWWEIQGNAINAGPVVVGDAYSRAYTYKPKDTAPVTVTVHGKAKDSGDDLGQKSITITAKPYEVKIGEPRLTGPPPRVWSDKAKGLVEVPRAIATFQDFFVNASVSPAPPDPSLRYEWKSQPEGCSISSPGSQETRGNASQAGTFSLSVTVRDNQGVTLGSGMRTISIIAPTPEPKKAEPTIPPAKTAEALAKLKESSALAADGKLDEAIAVAEQAAALDPSSRPISSYLQQLKAAKAQKLNPQKQNEQAAPSKASEATAKVKQAGVLFQQNKIAEALALSEEALQLDPNNTDAGRYVQTCRNILLADQKLKQARDLNSQSKIDEALALSEEAHRLDPDNTLAVTYIQILQSTKHLKQAASLGKAGQLEEAAAEIAEAKKIWPSNDKIPANEQWIQELITQRDANKAIAEKKKAEAASLQAAIQAATQHLDKALSLGKAGQIDEAAAEVAEAKKVGPSHSKIPEFERWIAQLRQQQAAADAVAQAKKAEQANQQAAIQAATQHLEKALSLGKAGQIDEAAGEVAAAKEVYPSHSKIPEFELWISQLRQQREAAAKAAAEANKPQGPPRLAGTQWEGTAGITVEGTALSFPFRISIDGNNQISGEMTIVIPGEDGSEKANIQGFYDSGNGSFQMTCGLTKEGVSIQLTLTGAAASAALAQGKMTMKLQMQGLPDASLNGSWRTSRK